MGLWGCAEGRPFDDISERRAPRAPVVNKLEVMEDGVQVTWLEVDKEDPTKYRKGESSTDPVPFNCWSHLMNGRYFEDECIYITPHIGDNRSA